MGEERITVSFSFSKSVVWVGVAVAIVAALAWLLVFAKPIFVDEVAYRSGTAALEAVDAYYAGEASIRETYDVLKDEQKKLRVYDDGAEFGISLAVTRLTTYALLLDHGSQVDESKAGLKDARDDLWDDLHGIF